MPVHLLKCVVFTIYNQDSTGPLIVHLHIENSEFRIIITTLNYEKQMISWISMHKVVQEIS